MFKEGWKWVGCSDDINFGIEFFKIFVDVRECGCKGEDLFCIFMNLYNNNVGRMVS